MGTAKRCLATCLALCLCGLLSTVQGRAADFEEVVNTRRELNSVGGAKRFPYCSCKTFDFNCSPYTISRSTTTTSSNGNITKFCFAVTQTGCGDSRKKCCAALLATTHKISFRISSACAKPAIYQVSVGGKKFQNWETTYYPTPNAYDLRIYNLGWTQDKYADEVCVYTKTAECGSINELCDTDNGECQYSLTESGDHTYCPVGTLGTYPPPMPQLL